jgi:hypothetical protein
VGGLLGWCAAMMNFLRIVLGCNAGPRRLARHKPVLEELEVRALPAVMHPLSHVLGPLDGSGGVPGFTPQQIRHAYGFDSILFADPSIPADGSGQTIALVTAFNDPNLATDVSTFDARFSLPDPSLTVVAQDGSSQLPAAEADWAQETALDVEWVHAIAPQANLLVVEANSANEADLYAAVDYAVRQPGVGIVSLSFGEPESASELQADQHFQPSSQNPNVVFVAAAGDASGVTYPAASPYVIGVGGTTLTLDGSNNRASETAWAKGGGGVSKYEAAPSFQAGVTIAALNHRYTPDVAYAADPATGFAVYDSFGAAGNGWISVGGTSAGAPQWAGLLAIVYQGRGLEGQGALGGSGKALSLLYSLPRSDFYDITAGGNGNAHAGPGYDLVTGLGSPNAAESIPALMGTPNTSGSTSTPPVQSAPPPPLHSSGADFSEVAGAPFVNILAFVNDFQPTASPGSLVATVNWGDGRITSGDIVPIAPGLFGVIGRGTYAAAGNYLLTVTVTDSATGQTAASSDDVLVLPPATPPDSLGGSADGFGGATDPSTRATHLSPETRTARSFPRRHRHATPHALKVLGHHRQTAVPR